MIDRTLLNIASLELGAIGLSVIFLDYGAPEVHAGFWGTNLYAVKREVIASTRDRAFLVMAATSVVLQIVAEIWEPMFSARLYSTSQYLALTVALSVVLGAISSGLWAFVKRRARREWQPQVIEGYREPFESARALVENQFVSETQRRELPGFPPEERERVQAMNREQVTSTLGHVERLMELSSHGDFRQRVARLDPYFKNAAKAG